VYIFFKIDLTIDTETSFSKDCPRDCPSNFHKHQIPKPIFALLAGSSRSLYGFTLWRHQSLRNPFKESHNNVERPSNSKPNSRTAMIPSHIMNKNTINNQLEVSLVLNLVAFIYLRLFVLLLLSLRTWIRFFADCEWVFAKELMDLFRTSALLCLECLNLQIACEGWKWFWYASKEELHAFWDPRLTYIAREGF